MQVINQEKFDCYMLTAGVMSSGGIEFKTKGRDDQVKIKRGHRIVSTHSGRM